MNRPAHLLLGAAIVLAAVLPAIADDFTLSDKEILDLDYGNSGYYVPPLTATVLSKNHIPDTGVQFTIHFAGTNSHDATIFRLSDRTHGAGTLAGVYIGIHTNFALKFTLISVDGATSGNNNVLAVGAVVGPFHGTSNGFRPELISLSSPDAASATSVTISDAGTINVLGFTAYQLPGAPWPPGPHTIKLLVEPARDATTLGEIQKANHTRSANPSDHS
jgi:hypothetical protein